MLNGQTLVESGVGASNVRYNPETDKVQIYVNGEWINWKSGGLKDSEALIPTMASYTSPKGEVGYGTYFDSRFYPWKAFDNDNSGNWLSAQDVTDSYITYTFDSEVTVKKIDLVNTYSDNWTSSSSTIYVYGKRFQDADFTEIGRFSVSGKTFSLLNQELIEMEDCKTIKIRIVGNGSYVSLSRVQVYGFM